MFAIIVVLISCLLHQHRKGKPKKKAESEQEKKDLIQVPALTDGEIMKASAPAETLDSNRVLTKKWFFVSSSFDPNLTIFGWFTNWQWEGCQNLIDKLKNDSEHFIGSFDDHHPNLNINNSLGIESIL